MEGKARPEATAEQALYEMDRLIALAQFGQQDIAGRLGLNVTDLTCLGFVIEASLAGEPLGASDLAARARLSTGAVTGVLNRLEKSRFIRRESDLTDRRRVWVVMDESAQARILEVYGPFYERLRLLVSDFTRDEVAVLADWFAKARTAMQKSLDDMRDAARAEGPSPAQD
ncbi:MarR family transcriptional regulator [Streptomyces sp. NBC_00377]|uniref:MarR family transcriptional regulator n=1 Tax=unclassified Streptomyces TaxID=2593676 RepID=UPI002E121FB6|nr:MULTISPECIES: MarR family transcriptional regulator [unclassified Streptomyces]WSN46022.1 MarR family transcriptional regulator [Streptomyces sp. NBC_01334]